MGPDRVDGHEPLTGDFLSLQVCRKVAEDAEFRLGERSATPHRDSPRRCGAAAPSSECFVPVEPLE